MTDILKLLFAFVMLAILVFIVYAVGGLALSVLLGVFGVTLGFWKSVWVVFLASIVIQTLFFKVDFNDKKSE